jgi:hypothetical protein
MGFDLGALALGDLFFGGEVGADLGLGALGADLGIGAADVGADVGLAAGAADVAGVGADVGAGLGIADLGLGGADIGAALGTAGALDAALPEAALGGAAGVEDVLGAAAPEAIAAAPDLAGAAAAGADLGGPAFGAGAGPDISGLSTAFADQSALGLPGGGFPGQIVNAGGGAGELAGVASPTSELAGGSSEIGSQLGSDAFASADLGAETQLPAAAAGGVAAPGAGAAAPAASASGAAAGGGGLGSTIGAALNSPITKAAELGLPLGFLGYNLLKGPPQLPSTAQQALANVPGQTQNVPALNQTVQQDLSAANNFQLNPGQAASVAQFKSDQYNQLYQQLANEGNVDPTKTSQWLQGKNQIDQQALKMTSDLIQQLFANAIAAEGSAVGATSAANQTLLQAANIQVQQDNAFQTSISEALKSFGLIAALQGRAGGGQSKAA